MNDDILRVQGINSKGFGIIAKLAMQDRRLTVQSKAIYAYFCSFAGAGTTAFPSREKIIYDLQISKDTYYKHFNKLKEYGYIQVEQEKKDSGRYTRNIYTLMENIPCPKISDTVTEPCPNLPDTEISDTNNNSIKNNKKIRREGESTPPLFTALDPAEKEPEVKKLTAKKTTAAKQPSDGPSRPPTRLPAPPAPPPTPPPNAKIYGDYKMVILTDAEYRTLAVKYGEAKTMDYIGQLDRALADGRAQVKGSVPAKLESWILHDEKTAAAPKEPRASKKPARAFNLMDSSGRNYTDIEEREKLHIEKLLAGSS